MDPGLVGRSRLMFECTGSDVCPLCIKSDMTGSMPRPMEQRRFRTDARAGTDSAATARTASSTGIPHAAVPPWTAALRFARDPRTLGVLRAGPRVGAFLLQGVHSRFGSEPSLSEFALRPSPLMALQALVDEVLIALFHHPDLIPDDADFAPAGADVDRARRLFAQRGWLENPASFHRQPPPPEDDEASFERSPVLGYEHLTFTSGYEPYEGEPGRTRWLSHEANRTVHASIAAVPGRRRSWLICAPGFGMGTNAFIDLHAFRAPRLLSNGVNVAVPVLPLHGLRATGRVRGEDLMTIDMVDSLHGIAQAVWDVRRLLQWLYVRQGAERVGIVGYSFGALVAALVAALEPDLACVVAGIPLVDLPALFLRHSNRHVAELASTYGVLGEPANEVHRVVSPLAMPCQIPRGSRYIFAGRGDRMSTFEQAVRLWNHWDRPSFVAYQGGHVGFFWSKAARRLMDEAVDAWLVG